MSDSIKDKIKNLNPAQIRKLIYAAGKSENSAEYIPVPQMPRNKEAEYPLSKAQERIWFLSQLYAKTPLYNIPLAVKIKVREIDMERLSQSIENIVRENGILRTTFHLNEEKLFQRIHVDPINKIEYIDVSNDSTHSSEDWTNIIGREHASASFNLTELPLFTVKVVKLNPEEHILLLNLHHIISDGWTNSLLSVDINSIYNGYYPRREKQYTYVDYVWWEQQFLLTQKYRDKLFFWKEVLKELPPPAKFPRDTLNNPNSYDGEKIVREITHRTTDQINTFCKKENITPFQFHFICFSILSALYTQQEDLIIGTPVANRAQHYFKDTYGLFINSLPIRIHVTFSDSFTDSVRKLAPFINQCIQHQEVPFSEIVKLVNPERNSDENALFNLHFAYQHFPAKNKKDEYSLLPIDHKTSKFDLNFWVEVAGEESKISLTYRNRIIGKSKVQRFLSHYFTLISAVSDNSTLPLSTVFSLKFSDLSVLSGKEMQMPKESWIDLFSSTVRTSPDSIAAVDEYGILSYAELNKKADAIACKFAGLGIVKGDIIITDTGRNNLFISSIIACFRLGCAYLPVTKDIPKNQLQYIIENSKARLLFSDKRIDGIQCLDPKDVMQNDLNTLPEIKISGQDTAYIIYTSGTTGDPKGVSVPHSALLNYTVSLNEKIHFQTVESFAHVSSIQADLGNTSIFPALAYGKRLVLPSEEALRNPDTLQDFFSIHKVDVLKIVPSHLKVLLKESEKILPEKILICGGESLTPSLIETVRKISPHLRIINHYGPTETTIGVLTHEVPLMHSDYTMPVGRPLNNISIVIAGSDLQPVPKGVKGEICIGGASLANGYLNNSELTLQKFITIPHGTSGRYYKTGDIGYINENNEVVFSGRNDSQVKFNGYRLELSEIETLLKRHNSIQNAYVYVRGKNENSQTLHAVIQKAKDIDEDEIRNHLKQFLAGVFIPQIIFIKGFPLTANGKIDYKLLKESISTEKTNAGEAPRDLIEIKILEVFKSLFGDINIGLEDSFFDIGGHSLLAIQLVSRLNSIFNTNLNVSFLFNYSSIAEMAGFIRRNSDNTEIATPLIKLNDNSRQQKHIWIHPAGGNVMCYYPISQTVKDFADTWAFTVSGKTPTAKIKTIEDIAEEYFFFLKNREVSRNIILAGWSMGGLIAQNMATLFEKKGYTPPLVLIDQPAFKKDNMRPVSYAERLVTYLKKVYVFTNKNFNFDNVSVLSQSLDYQSILDEFIRIKLIPAEVSVHHFKSFLDILVRHNEIVSHFRPKHYTGPVLLLKAKEILEASDTSEEHLLEDLGWGQYCPYLTISEVPGNHITMMNSQNAEKISARIQNWLREIKQ